MKKFRIGLENYSEIRLLSKIQKANVRNSKPARPAGGFVFYRHKSQA